MGKMLHNEARELLVESYEKTHNAEEIAKNIRREQVYCLPYGGTQAENRQRGASHVAAG